MSYDKERFDNLEDYIDLKIIELERDIGELDLFAIRTVQADKSKKDVDKVCKRIRKEYSCKSFLFLVRLRLAKRLLLIC